MSIILNAVQKQRYDTAANWTAANPTLAAGELGVESDTGYFKVGDGSTAWTSLAYVTPTQFSGYPISTSDIADDAVTGDKLSNDITVANDLTVSGDLTVNGTTTTIESTTIAVDDKNIELGSVDTPTDATADGGGITLKGATDHTIAWTNSTDSWDFSEHVNIASGKEFRIAGTKVLDATSLGSGVVSSSLTSVGTITTGVWNGSQLSTPYIADGAITQAKLAGDVQFDAGDSLGIGIDTPEVELHVSSAATPTIRITNETGDNDFDISVTNTSGDAELMVALGSAIIFGANDTEAVRIEDGDLDVSGDIIVDGTVDGRDVATDGTKLDGIETGATADQTKADIDALNIDADTVDSLHASSFVRADADDTGTGGYSTTGSYWEIGEGSGSVSLTTNDGYGNANITFNHREGTPDQDGNSARIEVNTDVTSGAYMAFELKSNTSNGTAVALTKAMEVRETYVDFPVGLSFDGGTYVMDEYEEGTFTPVYAPAVGAWSPTYDMQNGNYIRIGDVCHFRLRLRTDTLGVSSAQGTVDITGLPFTARATTHQAVSIHSASFPAGDNPYMAFVHQGTNKILLYKMNSTLGNSPVRLTDVDFGNTANDNQVYIAGSYQVQ